MPSFPGTSLSGGVGTFVLLPDGAILNYTNVSTYVLAANVITFNYLNAAAPTSYTAPSNLYAQKVKLALDSIPVFPASFYVITDLIPIFAVVSLSATNGPAAGGTAITVTGFGFVDGITANLGGNVATVTFTNSTTISFNSPAGTIDDTVSLTLRNPDGTKTVFPNAFTYT